MVKIKQFNRLDVISCPCELDYVIVINNFYLSFFNSFIFQLLTELQYEKIQILKGWTLFGEFLWTLLSTRIPHFWVSFCGCFWLNCSGRFLMVITNTHCWSANAGGAGAKPLIGSAETFQCPVSWTEVLHD